MKHIILVFLLLNANAVFGQNKEESFDKMLLKCEKFVVNYKPTYVIGIDTLIVSRFTVPPDDINKFLIMCVQNGDFRPLKYSCVLIIKQNQEYWKVNYSDYILDDPAYAQNGFLELLRTKMGVPGNEQDYLAPMFTGDICKWIHDHKKEIDDYQFIDKLFKKK